MKIVQLGACQGNDHVTRFIRENTYDFLLLVEANPLNIDKLKICYQNYNNVIIEEVGITPTNDEVLKFYYSNNNYPDYQISSFDINHLIKHKLDNIHYFEIKCKTLTSLLESYDLYELDYLFIDIEGVDAEVLLSLDLSKFDIKNIQIEILHLGSKNDDVLEYFKSHGYTMKDGIDFYNYDKMFTKV